MSDTAPRESLPVSENPNIPVLEGWVGLTEAGERLGISRQHSYKLAKNGEYKTIHRIGNSSITVVSTAEIEEKLQEKTDKEVLEDMPEE